MSNPLGRAVAYSEVFDPGLLFAIDRVKSREALGLRDASILSGVDRWTCYELSWLDSRGVPQVAIATIEYPADSPCIVESKSLKLFLGSMNFTRFASKTAVEETIRSALVSLLRCGDVAVSLISPEDWQQLAICYPPGESIDTTGGSDGGSHQLVAYEEEVEEVLHSNLLRSLCPVTSQPDWGTVIIRYRGKRLDRSSLMEYLILHRGYQGFHEECCERIFCDMIDACHPAQLWVGCFYTRRGGIDINPERWLPGSVRPELQGRLPRQ